MDISELDGIYQITTISDYNGPLPKRSDGRTEIKGGKTHRIDESGCVWTSHFKLIEDDPTHLSFTSTADPSAAADDFCLTSQSGDLTREPVTYEAILSVSRKGDKVKISGSIEFGTETTMITMMKT